MDLRAGSRNSNSILVPTRLPILDTTLSLHQPLHPAPDLGSCAPAQIDHRFQRSERGTLFGQMHFTTIRPREDTCQQESLLPESSASRTGARRGSTYHRVCGTVTGGVPCPPLLRVVFFGRLNPR